MTEKTQSTPMIACEIQRDHWDEDGVRHRKGTVVELPVEAALQGIETSALKRASPE